MRKCELWLAMDGWPKCLYLFKNKPKFNGVAGQWFVEEVDEAFSQVTRITLDGRSNLLYDSFLNIVKGMFPHDALVKVTLELDK